MPKVRNEQTEQAIRSAAWRLFFEKGVDATSYSGLAEVSGVSRPLVQRYVPKKELLVEWCVSEIRRAAVEVCDEAYPQQLDPLSRLYLRGQVNVATYFACEGVQRLMLDVFSSREMTQRTIAEGFRWTVSHTLPDRTELLEADEPDELIMAMGGLYELIYTYLARGKTPDVAAITQPSVEVFGTVFGVPMPADGFSARALDPDELQALASKAVSRIAW